MALMLSGSVTSSWQADTTWPSGSRRRAAASPAVRLREPRTAAKPASASWRPTSRPMPRLAPVMTATGRSAGIGGLAGVGPEPGEQLFPGWCRVAGVVVELEGGAEGGRFAERRGYGFGESVTAGVAFSGVALLEPGAPGRAVGEPPGPDDGIGSAAGAQGLFPATARVDDRGHLGVGVGTGDVDLRDEHDPGLPFRRKCGDGAHASVGHGVRAGRVGRRLDADDDSVEAVDAETGAGGSDV